MQKKSEVKMFEEEVAKIASDNTIKNSLINFDPDFSGLKDVVALFFPSMRYEMILRYRAETIAKIGIDAYRMVQDENIEINPIPPKIALPLLEHEPDIYKKWAKLLIATGVNPNPIYQQYADTLSNLNDKNANFLKDIFENQSESEMESKFEESINKYKFQVFYDNEESGRRRSFDPSEYENPLNPIIPFHPLPSFFHFPLIICGTEESIESTIPYYEDGKAIVNKYNMLKFSNEDNNLLLVLEKLGLIKYYFFYNEEKKDEEGKQFYVRKCGVLLTHFGYSFVDCFENPVK
jgi:hypothetical protein